MGSQLSVSFSMAFSYLINIQCSTRYLAIPTSTYIEIKILLMRHFSMQFQNFSGHFSEQFVGHFLKYFLDITQTVLSL